MRISDWSSDVCSSDLTAYFEKAGFQARISGRYRSKFLAEVSGLSLKRDLVTAKSEMVVDAQVGYTFQSGALEGLGILLQASNLTNEPFVTYYNNDPRQIRDYQNYTTEERSVGEEAVRTCRSRGSP